MKYVNATQTPILQENLIVAWVVRVQAEHGEYVGIAEHQVDLPVEERVPLDQWSVEKMQVLLSTASEQYNLPYKAADKVVKQLATNNIVL